MGPNTTPPLHFVSSWRARLALVSYYPQPLRWTFPPVRQGRMGKEESPDWIFWKRKRIFLCIYEGNVSDFGIFASGGIFGSEPVLPAGRCPIAPPRNPADPGKSPVDVGWCTFSPTCTFPPGGIPPPPAGSVVGTAPAFRRRWLGQELVWLAQTGPPPHHLNNTKNSEEILK